MIQFEDLTHLFNVDWAALREHVKTNLNHLPKSGGSMFSGWSVQGKNGSMTDGWVDGSAFWKKSNGKLYFDLQAAQAAGFFMNKEHVQLTDASSPALASCVERMTELGFQPCRSRLIQLQPGASSTWHTDGSALMLRMHFVIETNDQCWFKHGEEQRFHFKENCVYLINVNDYHQVGNDGSTDRTHLVTDVTDTFKVSKVHLQT